MSSELHQSTNRDVLTPSDDARVAVALFALYRQPLRPGPAAVRCNVSVSTARRHFKVFDLWQQQKTVLEIQSAVPDWSLDRVREVVEAISRSGETPETPPQPARPPHAVDPDYLAGHRQNLRDFVKRVVKLSQAELTDSVRAFVRGGWPEPFGGQARSAPRFELDNDPLGKLLFAHLSGLGVDTALDRLRAAGGKYGDAVLALIGEAFAVDAQGLLPQEIRIAVVDYGLQQVRKPSTERPPIITEAGTAHTTLTVGVYHWKYEQAESTASAVLLAEEMMSQVRESSTGREVISAYDGIQAALRDLGLALADSDLIQRTLMYSTCERCNGSQP
jgi:hypothetical protein